MKHINLITILYVPRYSVKLTCILLTLISSKKLDRLLKEIMYKYRKIYDNPQKTACVHSTPVMAE